MGVLCVLMLAKARGQDKALNDTLSKNAVYVELGGRGGIYSLGYERLLLKRKKLALSASVGVSSFPEIIVLTLPVSLNATFGQKRNNLVLSLSIANGFNILPTMENIKNRQKQKKEGKCCTPLGKPIYQFTNLLGVAYKRAIFKNKFSIETSAMCLFALDSDMDFTSGKCRTAVFVNPWLGFKLNYYLGKKSW